MTRAFLSPRYGYRFSGEAIGSAYATLEDAFDAGDYCLVAERAASGSELFGCAMVMVGFPHVGLPVLDAVAAPGRRGRLCRMLALWSLDRTEEAVADADALLAADPGDRMVRDLRRLMAAERIRIAQIAAVSVMHAGIDPTAAGSLLRCGPFEVEQLGVPTPERGETERGETYRFDRPFDRWLAGRPASERPDFILATTPQCFLPRNLADVPVPKIAYQHDSDVFIDRNWDNYRQFDLSLVATSFEHFELSRATGARCAAVFQNDPIGQPFTIGTPPAPERRRSIDVLLSGSILDYSHPEKARFAFLLSRLADERVVRIVEGYLPAGRYAELLADAKFLPVVSRLRGNPSPRWRDALCNGAYCLYPKDTLFGRLSRGLFAYDEEDPAESVRGHLNRYDRSTHGDAYCHESAWRDVENTYRFFAVPQSRRLETALKATVFMQAMVNPPPSASPPGPARTVWLMPFWEAAVFDPQAVAQRALRMAQAAENAGPRDEADIAHLAALHAALAIVAEWRLRDDAAPALADLAGISAGTLEDPYGHFVAKARALLADGIRRFPDSLLLRFNSVHLRLLFGLPLYQQPPGSGQDPPRQAGCDVAADCLAELDRLIAEEPKLRFDPRGAGFGFAPAIHKDRLFPYMRLSSGLLQETARQPGKGEPERLRPLVRGALYGYRGRLALELGHPDEALDWFARGLAADPENLGLLENAIEIGVSRFETGALDHDRLPELVERIRFAVSLYPLFLFRWSGRFVEMLLALGRRDEARSVLEDWYRFGRSIEWADGLAASVNPGKYRAMLEFRDLLPERLRQNLTVWRQTPVGEHQTDPDTAFDRFLLASIIWQTAGIDAALDAVREAAERLSLRPGDPGCMADARHARLHLVERLAGLPPGIAFAIAVMSQRIWDPGWSVRHRASPGARQWTQRQVAALRAVTADGREAGFLAEADGRLGAGTAYEAARWLLVVPLYRNGDELHPHPVLPRAFPRDLLMFAASFLGVPEERLARSG